MTTMTRIRSRSNSVLLSRFGHLMDIRAILSPRAFSGKATAVLFSPSFSSLSLARGCLFRVSIVVSSWALLLSPSTSSSPFFSLFFSQFSSRNPYYLDCFLSLFLASFPVRALGLLCISSSVSVIPCTRIRFLFAVFSLSLSLVPALAPNISISRFPLSSLSSPVLVLVLFFFTFICFNLLSVENSCTTCSSCLPAKGFAFQAPNILFRSTILS